MLKPRSHQSRRALLTAALAAAMVVAMAVPAMAQDAVGQASGWVKWDGESGASPGRTSRFQVVDGAPGADNDVGDSGYYVFKRKGVGRLLMDIRCVKVEGDWAEFTGPITRATGRYTVGEVFVVSVKDGGNGNDDEIGMKYWKSLSKACDSVFNDKQLGRKGIIKRGDIRVSDPR